MDKQAVGIVQEFLKMYYAIGSITIKPNQIYLRQFLTDNIERGIRVLESYIILNNIAVNNCFEHPIGIMLRSALNDYIVFAFYCNESKVNNIIDYDLLETKIKEQTLAPLNKYKKDSEFVEHYKDFYNYKDNGEIKTFNELKGIMKKAPQNAKNYNDRFLKNVVNLWDWYSKYEHYGIFTPLFYKENDNIVRQNNSVFFIMQNIFYSLMAFVDMGADNIEVNNFSENIVELFKRYSEATYMEVPTTL